MIIFFGQIEQMFEVVALHSSNDAAGTTFYLLETIGSAFERRQNETLSP